MREVFAALCEDDVFQGTTIALVTMRSSPVQSNLLEHSQCCGSGSQNHVRVYSVQQRSA